MKKPDKKKECDHCNCKKPYPREEYPIPGRLFCYACKKDFHNSDRDLTAQPSSQQSEPARDQDGIIEYENIFSTGLVISTGKANELIHSLLKQQRERTIETILNIIEEEMSYWRVEDAAALRSLKDQVINLKLKSLNRPNND